MPRFEFSDGTSNKFWTIELSGKSFTTTYGKIGSNGQTTIKTFGSDADAKTEYDKLVAEKTKKGYVAAGVAKASKAATKPNGKANGKSPAHEASGGMYEFVGGGSSKFWEITFHGTTITTRYGKIGTAGQETTKTHKSAHEARAAHDKLVAEKTKKGYKLVRGDAPAAAAPAHARDPKLEAAIESAPDDADGYLVYADWLQTQGDPRGELIALQHAKKTAPAKKLIEQNRAHFYGKLADFTDILDAYPYHPLGTTTTWRWGYLEKIWISNKHDRSSEFGGEKPEIDVEDALGWLLDHPSARFVRELTVGIVTFANNSYGGIAKVIGKRTLPTLRKLILGDFYSEETELNWSDLGNVQPVYAAVPNLESLTLRSGRMKLGTIHLPKLRELVIYTGGMDRGSLKSIAAAKWPVLETLSVQLGNDHDLKVKDVEAILDGKAFPKVKHLGLGNSDISDELCKALASSKIAAQLETLDLSLGKMGDDGATALAAGKFPKLHTLDVTRSWLSKRGLAALKPLAKTILAKNQEDDGGDRENRYIAAYE